MRFFSKVKDKVAPAEVIESLPIDQARYRESEDQIEMRKALDELGERSLSVSATEVVHLDGIDWINAPIPPMNHVCWPQTRGWIDWLHEVHRCACGALWRSDGYGWSERNSRTSQ